MTLTQFNRAIAIRAELDALDQRRAAFNDTYTNIYDIDNNIFQQQRAQVIASLQDKRAALVAEFQAL